MCGDFTYYVCPFCRLGFMAFSSWNLHGKFRQYKKDGKIHIRISLTSVKKENKEEKKNSTLTENERKKERNTTL